MDRHGGGGACCGAGAADRGWEGLVQGVEPARLEHRACVRPPLGEQEPWPKHREQLEIHRVQVPRQGVPHGFVEGVAGCAAVRPGDRRRQQARVQPAAAGGVCWSRYIERVVDGYCMWEECEGGWLVLRGRRGERVEDG